MKLAVVVAQFNEEITSRMRELALARAGSHGADAVVVVDVPGAMEIPLALSKVLARDDVDGAVVLGAVVQGETQHDEVIVHAVAAEVARQSVRTGKPVGFGVTGPGMTWEQAEERVTYAERAVDAALRMHEALRD